jgi:Dolichyl-phosphate-mannose-protein mannosyltransferase
MMPSLTLAFTRLKPRFLPLLLIVLLLLLYVFTRLHSLLALPAFIDESIHINWAQDVYRGHLLSGASDGRLLALWWLALFQLSGGGLLWLARAATVLMCTLNATLLYSIGKNLGSKWVGLLAAGLYILMPLAAFYERLTMPDSYVATFGLFSLWFCIRYVRKTRALDAALAGLALTAAILAKGQGLALACTPLFVVGLLGDRLPFRKALEGLVIAYGSFMFTWIPIFLFLSARGWVYFGRATTTIGTGSIEGVVPRLVGNIAQIWTADVVYLSLFFMLLTGGVALYLLIRRPRFGLMLVLLLGVPLIFLLSFSTFPRTRYVEFHAPYLILLFSVGLGALAHDLLSSKRKGLARVVLVLSAVSVIAIAAFGLRFQLVLYQSPQAAALPAEDYTEYISADSSGYALDQVAMFLATQSERYQNQIHVIGLVSNCGGLALEIPLHRNVTVECPLITFTGSEQQNLAALVNREAAAASGSDSGLWFVNENTPYITLDGITATYEKVISFDRPGTTSTVTLYRVH